MSPFMSVPYFLNKHVLFIPQEVVRVIEMNQLEIQI